VLCDAGGSKQVSKRGLLNWLVLVAFSTPYCLYA
jgi:hypothetical protein